MPEYGIEVYTHLVPPGADSPLEFHPSRDELSGGGCVLRMLDRIRVKIGVEFGPLLRPRLAVEIVEPRLPQAAQLKRTGGGARDGSEEERDGRDGARESRRVPFGQRGATRQGGRDSRDRRDGRDGRDGRKSGMRASAEAERRRPVEFSKARRG